jgi:hypothetical protein
VNDQRDDDLLSALGRLSTPPPSSARDARTRARCHAAIGRRTTEDRVRWPRLFSRAAFSPANALLACGLGAYGVLLAVEALRLARRL